MDFEQINAFLSILLKIAAIILIVFIIYKATHIAIKLKDFGLGMFID